MPPSPPAALSSTPRTVLLREDVPSFLPSSPLPPAVSQSPADGPGRPGSSWGGGHSPTREGSLSISAPLLSTPVLLTPLLGVPGSSGMRRGWCHSWNTGGQGDTSPPGTRGWEGLVGTGMSSAGDMRHRLVMWGCEGALAWPHHKR